MPTGATSPGGLPPVTITFDHALTEGVLPWPGQWYGRLLNFSFVGTAGLVSGHDVVLEPVFGDADPGADFVAYSAVPAGLRDIADVLVPSFDPIPVVSV